MAQFLDFNQFCEEELAKTKTTTISREKGRRLIHYLRTKEVVPPLPEAKAPGPIDSKSFKRFADRHNFYLLRDPELGIVDQLREISDEDRKVVFVEDWFEVIQKVHEEIGHFGVHKTFDRIKDQFCGIPRDAVTRFIGTCLICAEHKSQQSLPPIQAIKTPGIHKRGLLDLIDLSRQPDGDFKYIAHYIDHYSKFHVLWPLMHKSAAEVAIGLKERVLAIFGAPSMFQSDNGSEFVNQVIYNLIDQWPGTTKIIHGRPYHPQSQGVVERHNRTVKDLIRRRRSLARQRGEEHQNAWTTWLPEITWQLNTTITQSTGTSPYKVLFGIAPNVPLQVEPDGERIIPLELQDDEVGYEAVEGIAVEDSDSDDTEGQTIPVSQEDEHISRDQTPEATNGSSESVRRTSKIPVRRAAESSDRPTPKSKQTSTIPATTTVFIPKTATNGAPEKPTTTTKQAPIQTSTSPATTTVFIPKIATNGTPKKPTTTTKEAPIRTTTVFITKGSPIEATSTSSMPQPTKAMPTTAAPTKPISTTKPASNQRTTAQPPTTRLGPTKPRTAQPASTQPATKPATTQPTTKPAPTQPTTKPAPTQPTMSKPPTTKSSTQPVQMRLAPVSQSPISTTAGTSLDTALNTSKPSPEPQAGTSRVELQTSPLGMTSLPTHHLKQQLQRDLAKKHIKQQEARITKVGSNRAIQYTIGQYVSVAIPKNQRAAGGGRRLMGIILKISGNLHKSYKIGTGFCVLQGKFPAASLDPYTGELNIDTNVAELPVLSIKQAAEIAGPQMAIWTCRCRTNCLNRRCPCRNHDKLCSSDCHGGRECRNTRIHIDREEGRDETRSSRADSPHSAENIYPASPSIEQEEPNASTQTRETELQQTHERTVLPILIQDILKKDFAEDSCSNLLHQLESSPKSHTDFCVTELRNKLPLVPASNAAIINESYSNYIGKYGDGYVRFIPKDFLRQGYQCIQTSGLTNSCLFEAASLVVYGHKRPDFLRLATLINGVNDAEQFAFQKLQTLKENEVEPWISSATSEEIYQEASLISQVKEKLSYIVTEEMYKTAKPSDSGSIQLHFLSEYLRRRIVLYTKATTDVIPPLEQFGDDNPYEAVYLLRVPSKITHDIVPRYSHIVPLVPAKDAEVLKVCGMSPHKFCAANPEEEPTLECEVCCQRYHSFCIQLEETDLEEEFQCGCTRSSFSIERLGKYKNPRTVQTQLQSMNYLEITRQIQDESIQSWRKKAFTAGGLGNKTLLGLGMPSDLLPEADIYRMVSSTIEQSTDMSEIVEVIIPELTVRLICCWENVNRLIAEIMIRRHNEDPERRRCRLKVGQVL